MRRPFAGRAAVVGLTGEEQFEQWVVSRAEFGGWHGFHVRKSFGTVRGVPPQGAFGWPDWCFWSERRRRFIARELKTQRGVVSSQQRIVLAQLVLCGIDAKVWRPSDEQEIRETFAP